MSDVTAKLIDLLRSRDANGLAKYGVTLDRTDLTQEQWCQHAIEEMLDAAGYLAALQRTLALQDTAAPPNEPAGTLDPEQRPDSDAVANADKSIRAAGISSQPSPATVDLPDGLRLLKRLIAATAVPLEVLDGEIKTTPDSYRVLSPMLKRAIADSVIVLRDVTVEVNAGGWYRLTPAAEVDLPCELCGTPIAEQRGCPVCYACHQKETATLREQLAAAEAREPAKENDNAK